MSYERGLRQRNKLLDAIREGLASRSQLLFWNQLLIKAGGYLTDKREEFISYVNSYLMSGVEYRIEYDKSVISEARLEQYRDEEVAAKATLVGPHRDDIHFLKAKNRRSKTSDDKDNFLDLSKYGSRGEQRLAILWLKLAEVSFIQDRSGERPILLLDDIFSELDENHRKLVMSVVRKQQTIITSAEEEMADVVQRDSGAEVTVMYLSEYKE
jgi:DNA replication and repair protein RecF